MLVDREGMWFRVLTARYGDGGGGIEDGWFGEHISKKLGDGSNTFSWTDPWLDEIPLCERYGRLFDLAETKSVSVTEMSLLGWGAGGVAWVWRRQLRVWEEEMLGEC
ncbi:receptor-like kinase [Trifolium medium]|uniref:Receptor-like kinase n=1 Tax=Trifolium medium TaxID=97028 RepID=A0A392R042_9FABA|nr:receptor-like kinase [Trifolium medium]